MAKWFLSAKKADFRKIAEEFHIDPVIARIIRNREIVTNDEISMYLKGDCSNLHKPDKLKDAVKAAMLLKDKIHAGRKIRIIGDYDVDGICSTYILYKGLSVCGADVDCVIPHRMKDGYGINADIVKKALEDGVDTIITCDNGIAAKEVLENGKNNGLTCIVTDHHEIPFDEDNAGKHYRIPDVDAVVDPKQEDCGYPFKEICGAVVAYKVMQLLLDDVITDKEQAAEIMVQLVEPAGIATVCDIMPLVDENRILVKEALKSLQDPKNPGIRALMKVNELDFSKLTSFSIGFVIGPCLNATGRLDSAQLSLELLMAETFEEAVPLATTLKEYNANRKEMTEKGVEKAIALLEEGKYDKDRVLVLYLPDVHESLAGIIAGRIREKTGKPVFVLTKAEEGIKGSARSIESYHIYDEMTKCRQFFTKYGGHKMAAGLSMPEENLEAFREAINNGCTLTDDDFEEKIVIDVPMPLSYVTKHFIEELSLLEPFGTGNEKPVFAQKNIKFLRGYVMGKNRNMARFDVMDEQGMRFMVVCFKNLDKLIAYMEQKEGEEKTERLFAGGLYPEEAFLMDVVYYPSLNEYRGQTSVQYILQDYR